MIQGYTPPADLARVRNIALGVGVVFTLLMIVGALFDRPHFFHGYLVGYIFWVGITVGSLALLMLQHLTGGAWGLVIRRVLEASTRTLPLMVLLFVPIIIGLNHIYPWTDPAVMGTHRSVAEKGRRVSESVVLHHSRGDLFRHLVGSGHAFELAFASARPRRGTKSKKEDADG